MKLFFQILLAAAVGATGRLHAQAIQISQISRTVSVEVSTNARTASDANLGTFFESFDVTAGTNYDSASEGSDLELSGNTFWATGNGITSGSATAFGISSLRFNFAINVPYSFFLSVNFFGPTSPSGNQVSVSDPFGTKLALIYGTTNASVSGVIPVPPPGPNQYSFEALVQGVGPATYQNLVWSMYPVIGGNIPPPTPAVTGGPGGGMWVEWPLAATNLILEVATNLASPVWLEDTNAVETSGAFFAVPVGPGQQSEFFRLREPD
jgi:hypothetical protein